MTESELKPCNHIISTYEEKGTTIAGHSNEIKFKPESCYRCLSKELLKLQEQLRIARFGFKLILKSKCCPENLSHGNTCPRWIAEEALSQLSGSKEE